jgi:hypothetical protein
MEPAAVGARTERGWELRQEARGLGRFVVAAFLLAWITGWAVGEAFALGLLVRGVAEWIGLGAPLPGQAPAASIGIAAFLLIWLALWTLGGVAAIHQLLSLLWGGTAVIARPDGIVVDRWAGPFRSRRHVPRDSIQAVRVQPRGRLSLETTRGGIDLLQSGRAIRLEQFAAELRRELQLVERDDSALALPAGWAEVLTPEGHVAVTRDPAIRRRQAVFVAALTLSAAAIALSSLRLDEGSADGLPLAIGFGFVAAALGACTLRLALGRTEWCLSAGRLVLQRRFGSRVSTRFIARGLELVVSTDSDGDEWFSLDATADPPDASAPPPNETTIVLGRAISERRQARRIARGMNDASEPRALGRWLADHGHLAFLDRTRLPRPQAVSVAELRAQLAAAGRFGKFLDRIVGPALERCEKKGREGPL